MMSSAMSSDIMRLLAILFLSALALAQPPAFPIKVSADRRYLTGSDGKPFLYVADSAWALVKHRNPAEIDEFLDRRAGQGFTAIQFHAVSKEVSPPVTYDGIAPFKDINNIATPNEPYWKKVDYAVEACAKRNLVAAISALWIRWGGSDKEGWRFQLTPENARGYGEFLGKRYARYKNVLWILGGDANPRDRAQSISELARGIKAFATHHLITVHNAPENPSAHFFHSQPWLDINMCYTYRETYQQVYAEWHRSDPVRPLLLGESGYELEDNDKRGGTPYRIRRQAWGAMLGGALAGQAYGHREIWRMSDKWRDAVDSPGAKQIQVWAAFFKSLPWYTLVPQHEASEAEFVVSGTGFFGADEFVTAAVSTTHLFAVAYLPVGRTVSIRPEALRPRTGWDAFWIDPTTGARTSAAPVGAELTPPARNAAGDPDWVLFVTVRN
jgi:hypothetical protein